MSAIVATNMNLVPRLLAGAGTDFDLSEDIFPLTNHAHFVAPILWRLVTLRGFANRISEAAGEVLEGGTHNPLWRPPNYVRDNVNSCRDGVTLEVVIRLFSMIEAIFKAADLALGAKGVETREILKDLLGLKVIPGGVVSASIFYCEGAPLPKDQVGPDKLVRLETLIERFAAGARLDAFSAELLEGSDVDVRYRELVLPSLVDGYLGNSSKSRGGYKVTKATAWAIYSGFQRLTNLTGAYPLEAFEKIFSKTPRSGPRDGQATRSLSVLSGNIAAQT